MDFIVYKQPRQCKLFHGTTIPKHKFIIEDKTIWCAHRLEDTKSYSETNVVGLTNIVDLKLIDVTHPAFHNDFITKMNNLYFNMGQHNQLKGWPLAAFGLPDLQSQVQLTTKMESGIYPDDVNLTQQQKKVLNEIESFVPYYNHKHRMSTTYIDTLAVKHIIRLYTGPSTIQCDGFTSNALWPSYHMGGLFHPETCIFSPKNKLEVVNISGGKKRNRRLQLQYGGQLTPFRGVGDVGDVGDVSDEDFMNMIRDMQKTLGKGIEFDPSKAIYNELSGLR